MLGLEERATTPISPCFLRHGLLLAWSLQISSDWLPSKSQGSLCLCFQAGISSKCYYNWLFLCGFCESKLAPHAFKASSLPTGLPPQLLTCTIKDHEQPIDLYYIYSECECVCAHDACRGQRASHRFSGTYTCAPRAAPEVVLGIHTHKQNHTVCPKWPPDSTSTLYLIRATFLLVSPNNIM